MWEAKREEAESAERQAPVLSEEREKEVTATKTPPDAKSPREKTIQYISEEFKEMPSKKVVEVLLELSEQYDADFLGFEVFPYLKIRLSTDVELFRELVALLVDPPKGVKVTEDLGYVLLEFLDTAAHGTGLSEGILQEYRESLKKVIMNKKLPESVRATATRALAEEKTKENVDVVHKLIKSGSRGLIDAAARVLWAWSRASRLPQDRLYPKIVKDLVKHAKSKPDEIFKSPSIMRLFGYLKTDTANDVLDYLIKKAKKPEHWASLLSSVGSHSSPDQLARMIQGVIDKPTPLTMDVLTGVISSNPCCMEGLFAGGHHKQYAFALAASKIVDYPGWATHLTKLRNSTEPIVAQSVRGVSQVLPHEKRLVLHRLGVLKVKPIPKGTSEDLQQKPDSGSDLKPAGEASEVGVEKGIVTDSIPFTFAYRGDALYNAGTTSHWHAGLYLGFSVMPEPSEDSSSFWMRGIHNAMPFNGVLYFQGVGHFDDPDRSVKSEMMDVIKDFIETPRPNLLEVTGAQSLQEIAAATAAGGLLPAMNLGGFDCSDDKPYIGRRSPPELSVDKRAKITETAIQFWGRGIDWYWGGMVKSEDAPFTGYGWEGTIEEIGKTRCDGLVEYCYEKNWEPVCEGKRSEDWRIASPGGTKLRSHWKFHTTNPKPGGHYRCGAPGSDWTQGELCPKTQAGNVGTDTTFEDGVVEAPRIIFFDVTNSYGDIPPKITFEIDAPYSQRVYVRVTVKTKDESDFHFMIADDYWQCGVPALGTPVGMMNLMELAHDQSQSVYWFGKTADKDADGPDYWGTRSEYEFRLEVADQGGNVSETRFFKLDLEWPPIGKKERGLLLSEHPTSTKRGVSIVHCTFNKREASFPVQVDTPSYTLRAAPTQEDAPPPSDIQAQADGGTPLPPSPMIYDDYELEFKWEGTEWQHYTILVDGIACVQEKCTMESVKVPLRFVIKDDDSFMREVTVQLGESDCTDTIIVELAPPSISAIPYMNARGGKVPLHIPEDVINDAEISKGDVVIVDENATEADLREHPERSIFVKGVPLDTPELGPDQLKIPVFRYSYSWGYIKNPVYCDFDLIGLVTPDNPRGSVKKISSTGNPISDGCTREAENLPLERVQVCHSESFFERSDYDNDYRRVLEFETTDIARQRVTGQLTLYAKSLLCILENDWIQYDMEPAWGSFKDQLAIRVSEDLIMDHIGLGWDDKIALDQNLHEFARRLSTRMESALDAVLNDQSTWARIQDEAAMIVRRNEKQLTELQAGASGIENVEAAVEEINHNLAKECISHIMNSLSQTALKMPEHQEGFREVIQKEL